MSGAERREKITAEITARTGITEAMIERLVRGFYAKVRSDAVLAPRCRLKMRLAAAREAFMRELDATTLAECAYPARPRKSAAPSPA